MKPHPSLSQSLQKLTTPLGHAFQNLSRRDQIALLILAIFLLFFVVGVGGWTLHSKANQAQKKYDDTMADVFWLRSQAGNINPNQTQQVSQADAIKQILSQSGIVNAQVVENGNTIQVAFSHAQASVITNILNQFEQPAVDKLEVQSVLSIH
ncbi:type II secretion system protein GspM [Xanthomonas citri pv. citri]